MEKPKPRKGIFYVKEMSDKELDSIDLSKVKKLSKKEVEELLRQGKSTKK